MRRHAKASTAGSTQRQASGLGRFFRGVFARDAASSYLKGSGAFVGRRLLVGSFSALVLLFALASSASAVSTHPVLGFSPITGSGTGVTLHHPSGIAVDETSGNVFLNDGSGEGNVTDIFSAEGGVPSGVASPYQNAGFAFNGEPSGVAVDNASTSPSKGALYVVDVQHSTVKKFVRNGGTELYEAAGELAPSSGPAFAEPLGAAVDTEGNVFVADYGSSSVVEFGPTGTQLARIDTEPALGRPSSVALDATGDLFVQSYSNNGVYKYPVNGSGEIEPSVFTQIVASGGTGVAVDTATDQLFVGLGDRVAQYDATTLAPQLEFGSGELGNTARIAVNSATGSVYVADNGPSGQIVAFGTGAKVPGVATDPATGVTPTAATLNGGVNPDGLAVTECKFEYGTTAAYGSSKPCEGPIPPDSSDHAVTAALTGLIPGAVYHFRVTATNANGANFSSDQTFTTPNPAVTGPAIDVTGLKATLRGIAFPEGAPITECKFEYGTTTAYGSTVPCVEPIPVDENPHLVTAVLTHLAPNGITYHFRLAIVGGNGPAQGSDQTFVTQDTVVTGSASAITGTAATINGTVNPEEVPYTECKFEYGATTAYGSTIPCVESPGSIGSGTSPVAVHADLGALAIGTTYHFRLAGTNVDGTARGADESFRTASRPVIVGQWASDVTFTDATVKAQMDPEGYATTYHLEWGTDSSYGHSTDESAIGSDSAPRTIAKTLEGLTAGTTYHYRFVAISTIGVSNGPDHTFTTYTPSAAKTDCPNQQFRSGVSAKLPDCRAYEMVSPLDKNGASVIGAGYVSALDRRAQFQQSARSGNKITFSSGTAFGDALGSTNGNQYIATRGESGWLTHGINPPKSPNLFKPYEANYDFDTPFNAFTEDLSSAWVLNGNKVPLTADAAEGFGNLYRRDNLSGTFEALTIDEPTSYSGGFNPGALEVEFRNQSADGRHQVFDVPAALTPDADAGGHRQVYDLVDGQLHLVSVLPNGVANQAASFAGNGDSGAGRDAARTVSVDGAVSANGSRIFWSSLSGSGQRTAVYIRLNPDQAQSAFNGSGECTEAAKACTLRLDGPTPTGEAVFWTATLDGSAALLTAVTGAGSEGELYEFDVDSRSSSPIAGEVAGVLGATDDLSYIYFVSKEALAAGASAGGSNLYLDHDGAMTFIATLSDEDTSTLGPSAVNFKPVEHYSRMTPDGRRIAFMSDRSLTGYDNVDASVGAADSEVFTWSADSQQLICVSCNPSGARPQGKELTKPFTFFRIPNYWTAAWIPGFEHALDAQRTLSEDGKRIFFNSYDALLPRDSNGRADVYEWVESGTGDCEDASGCISLISTGESSNEPEDIETEFVDATPDGGSVFFRTSSAIDPRDPGSVDIYVARINGGFPLPAEPTRCVGDACQGAPEPPNDPSLSSAGFRGAGNPTPKREQRNCRARKRHAGKAHGPAKHKKAKRCTRAKRGGSR